MKRNNLKQRPDLIGKEFTGEVVWQYETIEGVWETEIDNEMHNMSKLLGFKTRQALSVPVNGEEKVDEATYTNGLDDGALHGWNLAIDAVLNKWDRFCDREEIWQKRFKDFRQELNELRK